VVVNLAWRGIDRRHCPHHPNGWTGRLPGLEPGRTERPASMW